MFAVAFTKATTGRSEYSLLPALFEDTKIRAAKFSKISKAGGEAVGLVEDGIKSATRKISKLNEEIVAGMRATFGEDLAYETKAITVKNAASEIDEVARTTTKTPLETINDPIEARAAQAESATARRDVQVHETAGGHTVEKHVKKSDVELKERLVKEPILDDVSSFYSEKIANRVQMEFVKQHKTEIAAWLKTGGSKFRGYVEMNEPIGKVIGRGKSSIAVESSEAFVVLVRDKSPQGYYIRTAFPVRQ